VERIEMAGAESKQAWASEPPAFRAAHAQIARAEREIDLPRRCRPRNSREQVLRWLAARGRGERVALALEHAPAPDLARLRSELERLRRSVEPEGPLGGLYAARAGELALDAELAENVSTPAFAALARRRHAEGREPEWAAARALAGSWSQAAAAADAGPPSRSDDASCPNSLVRALEREIGRLRLPVRVEILASLSTRAATADGVIYVQSGVLLGPREGVRIALHEVHGHALPRLRARAQGVGLFWVGAERASDDEEGRALLLEERAALFDAERRRELGLRHLAALAVAEGASADDCVRLLETFDFPPERAIELYVRVARGGGLCRELEYLPAWLRVSAAFARDPGLEPWLAHGRLSLAAARTLKSAGVALRPACLDAIEAR